MIPFLVLTYLLAFIDRANVGVAKLQMQGELHLPDDVIGFGAGIFFLGYFLLEIPGSLIVERWSARKWIARIAVSWGLIATLTGLIGTPLFGNRIPVASQFYAARFLLGLAEAGFFPGVIVYLSHWFRSEDRARAKAYFMVTQPLAVVIGTPVARWILETVHWNGWSGWRWVFILEGFPSVVVGLWGLFYLTDRVAEARWLPDDEKRWLLGELEREQQERIATNRFRITDAFRQPQTFLLVAILFLIVSGNQAMLFFLPSITETMQSLSIPWRTAAAILPSLCSAVGILLNGFSAHRTGERRWHTTLPILLTGVSLAAAILAGDQVTLVILFLCLAGFTSQAYLPVFWTLPTALLGQSAAATAIGLINSLGNLGGFAGPWLFGYLKTSTGRFAPGLWCLTLCMLLAGVLASQIRVPRLRRPI